MGRPLPADEGRQRRKEIGTREAAVTSTRASASDVSTPPAGCSSPLFLPHLAAGERYLRSSDGKQEIALNNSSPTGNRGGSTPYRGTGATLFASRSRSSASATRRVIARSASGSTDIESIPCSTRKSANSG